MTVQKLPGGTRGTRPPPRFLTKIMTPLMIQVHRLSGNRMGGMDLLYLTTVGAKSGQRHTNPVARFDDGQGGWVIVASAGGAAKHPGWYHNIVANPDQVWAEVARTKYQVDAEQLEGEVRDHAWAVITKRAPRFKGYETKTDRQIPVLRLTPTP